MSKLTIKGSGMTFERDIDDATAGQVMALVLGGSVPPPPAGASAATSSARTRRRAKPKTTTPGAVPKVKKRASGPAIVKDLSLRPKGKKAWPDVAMEKAPRTHQEKQLLAVFWLTREAGMDSGITVDHVNTCYQGAKWPRPSDLTNALSVTAKKSGWLDTSDKSDIKLTVAGEDHVDHDLPPKPKS
jgi:hypothetical protein